nr:PIN domain-containing protein [Kribbella antiqua]
MVVTWYVLDPSRLTDTAVKAMERETTMDRPISVSAYSVVELVYMTEKSSNGITPQELEVVRNVLADPVGPFVVVPVDGDVAFGVAAVPRTFTTDNGTVTTNADPGDRIIAATALKHNLGLVTSDPKIHGLSTVIPQLCIVWKLDERIEGP